MIDAELCEESKSGKRVPRTLTSTLLYTAWSGLGGRNRLKSKKKEHAHTHTGPRSRLTPSTRVEHAHPEGAQHTRGTRTQERTALGNPAASSL